MESSPVSLSARPSSVVISEPSQSTVSSEHEGTASPSLMTVQQPQAPPSQAFFAAVSPSLSLSVSSSVSL